MGTTWQPEGGGAPGKARGCEARCPPRVGAGGEAEGQAVGRGSDGGPRMPSPRADFAPRTLGTPKVFEQANDLIVFIHVQVHSGFCVDEAGKPGEGGRDVVDVKASEGGVGGSWEGFGDGIEWQRWSKGFFLRLTDGDGLGP